MKRPAVKEASTEKKGIQALENLPRIELSDDRINTDFEGLIRQAHQLGSILQSPRGIEVVGYKACVSLLRNPGFAPDHFGLVERMQFPEGPAKAFKRRMLLGHGRDEYRTRIRRVLQKIIGPAEVARQRPAIRSITEDLLSRLDSVSPSDLLWNYAFLTPATLFCNWFGAPWQDADWVARLSDRILKIFTNNPEYTSDIISGYDELFPYVEKLIKDYESSKSDNLMASFRHEYQEGNLSEQEYFDCVAMFNEASTDNTAVEIANVIGQILSNTELKKTLIEQPECISQAVRECIRLQPRSNAIPRFAQIDTEFEGISIKKGTAVFAWLSAAQRDPNVYDSPDEFVINRPKSGPILDFGGGIHACLGAHVALIEIEEAVAELLSRFPNAQLTNYQVTRNTFTNEVRVLEAVLEPSIDA